VKIAAPARVWWEEDAPTPPRAVTVVLQNRSPHGEAIADASVLAALVSLTVEPSDPGRCVPPTVTLAARQGRFPKTIKPKQKLAVRFDVAFPCVVDPDKATGSGPGRPDYAYAATVSHAALDGSPDSHPADDSCPRAPLGTDPHPDGKLEDRGCAMTSTDIVAPD
jgi:hypothetical protein